MFCIKEPFIKVYHLFKYSTKHFLSESKCNQSSSPPSSSYVQNKAKHQSETFLSHPQ